MTEESAPGELSIGQLGHHVGLHVSVNLESMFVGGTVVEGEHWVAGVVIGSSALGTAVTIQLDEPVGGGERHGLFHRESKGQDRVSIDDPGRIRPLASPETEPGGIPDEIVALVRAGKTKEAIKRYRAINGATLNEAQAAIARI